MKINKIGMRTIKTAFAVVFTIIVAQILNLRSPFFAGIAAIMAMQTSVSESLTKGKDRMYGTIIGGIIALVLSIIAPENVILIGIGIIIIIYLSNILGWKESTQMSMIVFLSIMLNFDDASRTSYVFNRILDTLIGLVIGTIINYFIKPPKVGKKVNTLFNEMYVEIKNTLEKIILKKENLSLQEFRERLASTQDNYNTYKKDAKYNLQEFEDITKTEKIIELFEIIYSHLMVISIIEEETCIDKTNKEYLKKLFNNKILIQDNSIEKPIDIVYNYHLEKIFNKLFSIEELLKQT